LYLEGIGIQGYRVCRLRHSRLQGLQASAFNILGFSQVGGGVQKDSSARLGNNGRILMEETMAGFYMEETMAGF